MENFAYFIQQPQILFPILIWTTFWKGLALWKAAQKKQVYWFIAILLINLLGIFSILYIYVFSEWDRIKTSFAGKKNKESFTQETKEEEE